MLERFAAPTQVAGNGQVVEWRFSDDGEGMAPEVVARAFEPFFTTKEGHHGTGLGLPMVQGIVEQLGGQVRLRSDPGGGTDVLIYLPAGSVAALSARGEATASVDLKDLDVLLVEDEGRLRALLEQVLEREGCRVVSAGGVQQALRAWEDRSGFDVLVTDVVMEDGRGTDLADRLRAGTPKLPVLFTTGYSPDAIMLDGDPRTRLLAKPFSIEAFITALKTVGSAG